MFDIKNVIFATFIMLFVSSVMADGTYRQNTNPYDRETYRQNTNPYDRETYRQNTNPYDRETYRQNNNPYDR